MKKCRRCTKPATMHITEIRNGEAQSLHLCEGCAQEYLNSVEVGGSSDEFQEGEGKPAASAEEAAETGVDDSKSCPSCGITFKQFRSQGRLGCPHDYEVFHDELIPLLESVHSDTQHVGKSPPHSSAEGRQSFELVRLRNDLREAVENESYEQAAKLRDRIKQLEAELEPPKSA
jgi:protein arginine kinase activator